VTFEPDIFTLGEKVPVGRSLKATAKGACSLQKKAHGLPHPA